MRVTYNKLVRDRIPEIIAAKGQHPVTRVLDDPAYQAALLDKLAEETEEVRNAVAPEGVAAELGDVLRAISRSKYVSNGSAVRHSSAISAAACLMTIGSSTRRAPHAAHLSS